MNWIDCDDQMPTERGLYLLYSKQHDQVLGPIPWIPDSTGKGGLWADLFATPEAGVSYLPPVVSHWVRWDDVKPVLKPKEAVDVL